MRIFISHSAKTPQAVALRDALRTGLEPEHSVRVDARDLEAGRDWRPRIHAWIEECDAAIVLLSKDATESAWVAYEAALLTLRRSRNPEFPVIPIHLGDVGREVEQGLLKPSNIAAIQSISVTLEPEHVFQADCDRALQTVRQRLPEQPPVRTAWNGIQRQTRYLVARLIQLQRLDASYVDQFSHKVDVPVDPWHTENQQLDPLARRLLALPLDEAERAIRFVGESFRENHVVAAQSIIDEMLDIVACAWVDPLSAELLATVCERTPNDRHVGLNAEHTDTARLYVVRSSGKPPTTAWSVVDTPGILSGSLEELRDQIQQELLRVFNKPDQQSLYQFLRHRDSLDNTTVVVLHGGGVRVCDLRELRSNYFPNVTFFVLDAQHYTTSSFGTDPRPELTLLEPELPDGEELRFIDNYLRVCDQLQLGPGASR